MKNIKSWKQGVAILILVAILFLVTRIPVLNKGVAIFSDTLAELSWEWREARKLHETAEPFFEKLQDGQETGSPRGESAKVGGGEFVITGVVDGDTAQGVYQGKKVTVRFIGINAPETGGPYRTKECLGEDATAYLKTLIKSKTLILELDPSQGEYDKYGRLLAYPVATDGQNIGEQMILAGMAKEYTYKKPYQYQDLFREAEKEAKQNKQGMWAENACQ